MKNRGYTLLELIITIVIVGVIFAVGAPLYLNHVKNSHVTEAQFTIDRIKLQMKTNLTRYGYMGSGETDAPPGKNLTCDSSNIESVLGMTLPPGIAARWDISVDADYWFLGEILNMSGEIALTRTDAIPFKGTIVVRYDFSNSEFTVE